MATDRRLLRFARQNRRETGLAETLLWNELRGRQLGPRFRRQDPQGPFIADFTWRSHKLVIEVDDWSHDDPEKDRSSRAAWRLAVAGGGPAFQETAGDADGEPEDRNERDVRISEEVPAGNTIEGEEHERHQHHNKTNPGQDPPRPQPKTRCPAGNHRQDRDEQRHERPARVVEAVHKIEEGWLTLFHRRSNQLPPVRTLDLTLPPGPPCTLGDRVGSSGRLLVPDPYIVEPMGPIPGEIEANVE